MNGSPCLACGEPLLLGSRADRRTHGGACRTRLYRQPKAQASNACVTGTAALETRWRAEAYVGPPVRFAGRSRAVSGQPPIPGRHESEQVATVAGTDATSGVVVQLTLFGAGWSSRSSGARSHHCASRPRRAPTSLGAA